MRVPITHATAHLHTKPRIFPSERILLLSWTRLVGSQTERCNSLSACFIGPSCTCHLEKRGCKGSENQYCWTLHATFGPFGSLSRRFNTHLQRGAAPEKLTNDTCIEEEVEGPDRRNCASFRVDGYTYFGFTFHICHESGLRNIDNRRMMIDDVLYIRGTFDRL